MTIPQLSYSQKSCIAIADNLLSMFARIGFMSSREINDVIGLLTDAQTSSGSDLEDEAFQSMVEMLRCLRADAVNYEKSRIISSQNSLP